MPSEPGGVAPAEPPTRTKVLRLGETYDPGPDRENTRSWLAKALAILLFVVSLSLIGGVAADWLSTEQAKDMALAVLSPLVALTGAALGFYFGGDERSR